MRTSSVYASTTQPNRASQRIKAIATALLLSSGSLGMVTLGIITPALADGTTAGTEIRNTAVGSFQNPNDIAAPPTTVTSNEVVVTVSEIAGLALTSNGFQEATAAEAGTDAGPTQEDGQISAEDVVYFIYTITNTGNDQTPFFIPGTPSNIQLNGSGTNNGGVLAPNSAIEIVSYSTDGSNQIAVGNDIPASGISTDDPAAIGAATGSIPVGGTVTIRVPVKLAAGLSTNDTVDVVLGDTPTVGEQNITSNGGPNDLVTQDNTGSTNGDIPGAPTNGEREASATNQVLIDEAPRDFGDLPDLGAGTTGPGAAPPTANLDYETEDSNGGPSHFINTTTFLGTAPTADTTLAVTTFAGQLDANGDANDDGVTITSDTIATATGLQGQSVLQGQQITLAVETTGSGNLQGWFDWNQDGDFNDPGEQVIVETATTGPGTSTPFTVTVPFGATPGETFALFRYSEDSGVGTTGVGGYGEVETFQVTVVGSAPSLALVKRVTSVGGTPVTGFVDDGTPNNEDNDPNWPTNFLEGSIDTSAAAPAEEIEYSLYFLSSGNDDITNLNLCDMVPANTTFVPGSITMTFNGTTTTPSGFFSGAPTDPTICPSDNGNGGILVNVATAPAAVPNATAPGTPSDSFGVIKFRVTVD